MSLKKGEIMGGSGQRREPPNKDGGKAKPLPPAKPAPIEDDDFEDGDFATPKRDRYGTDDEPL
jgi:hypothetical protein